MSEQPHVPNPHAASSTPNGQVKPKQEDANESEAVQPALKLDFDSDLEEIGGGGGSDQKPDADAEDIQSGSDSEGGNDEEQEHVVVKRKYGNRSRFMARNARRPSTISRRGRPRRPARKVIGGHNGRKSRELAAPH